MTRESAAVRESEQRFRDLFEHLPIPYQSLDIQGNWLDANPAMARLLGFDHPDELLGLDFGDCWDDASRQYFPATFSAFKNTGATRGELRLRRRDGSSITVILTGRISVTPTVASNALIASSPTSVSDGRWSRRSVHSTPTWSARSKNAPPRRWPPTRPICWVTP